jgi:hypothetical protein
MADEAATAPAEGTTGTALAEGTTGTALAEGTAGTALAEGATATDPSRIAAHPSRAAPSRPRLGTITVPRVSRNDLPPSMVDAPGVDVQDPAGAPSSFTC